MNKFQHLTKKLIQNSLWCSTLTYIPRTCIKNGIENTFINGTSIELKVVVSNINKNLVDNINLFNTDLTFIVDKLSLQNPSKYDLIQYNGETYKIVELKPIGILNNEPVGWSLIIRLS